MVMIVNSNLKILSILLLFFFINICYGQYAFDINFEGSEYQNHNLVIDTITDSNNIWQIGIPNKSVFTSAHSYRHALMTDTINPYPINDTSSFIIKQDLPLPVGGSETSLILSFWYKLNCDSLTDYGKIEFSDDNGEFWIDLLHEDVSSFLSWRSPIPILTGNTNGWMLCNVDVNKLTIRPNTSRTILYRFTFISDSTQTHKDGWMIDDFQLIDILQRTDNYNSSKSKPIFPNPTNGKLFINPELIVEDNLLTIYNNFGQEVFKSTLLDDQIIDIENLPNGAYFVIYQAEGNRFSEKIILNMN